MNSDRADNKNNRRDPFAVLALAYLVLPSLVFLLTWCRPIIGVPVALAVLGASVLFWRRESFGPPRPSLSTGNWVFVVTLAVAWTWLAGIGGFVWQASDYEKHNLAFHDLLVQSWPVTYHSGGESHYLCYGSGYYLVPVLIARAVSANTLPVATFLWGLLGVGLFFYWVATFGRSPKKTLAIVLLFAATETLWHLYLHLLKSPHLAPAGQVIAANFERLGVSSDYSDSFAALQFRPQHVLAAWLGTALFHDLFWVRRSPRGAGLVWASCWLWSPLMSLGLLLVPLAAVKRCPWREALEPINFCGGILWAALAIYFQGHVPLAEQGPIWKFASGNNWLWCYPWFQLLELGPLFLIYLADRKYHLLGELRPLFLCSLVVLLLLPLYKIGYYGDWRLQAQTPALLIGGLAASRCFQGAGWSLRRPLCALLAASQLLGAAYPFARWWQEALRARTDYSFAATQKL
ncbi:MAG TPA: hypothetical protein VL970_01780, partial [Candidatus Acidoferrales bacterium]|nr:hypothetical protein [Candidatus Acidoferrales bacterium]